MDSTTPPWELHSVRQVPFIEPTSKLGSRKTSRAESSGSIPKLELQSGRCTPAAFASPTAEEYAQQPPTYASLPYETRMDKTSPSRPPPREDYFLAVAPPTPPDSVKQYDAHSNSSSSEDPHKYRTIGGTMSTRGTRSRSRSKRRARSEGRQHDTNAELPENPSAGLGKKFKTAFKDLFHRAPVDSSNCEPLRTRHWTEEDY